MSRSNVLKQRIAYFESLRGIAALTIVLFHLGADTPLIANNLINNAWMMLDFFFILSGCVIWMAFYRQCHSQRGVADFLYGRFLRVYPLHVIMLGVFVVLEFVKWAGIHWAGMSAENAAFSENTLGALIHNLTLTNIFVLEELTWNKPSWSIAAEFWVYLIFAGLALTLRGNRVAFLGISFAIAASAGVFLALHDMSSYHGMARCLWGFFLGVLLMEGLAASRLRISLTAMNVIFVFCAAVLVSGPWPYDQPYSVGFTAIFFCLLVALFASPDEGRVKGVLSHPWLVYLGTLSFGVYLIHSAVWWVLTQAVRVWFKLFPEQLSPGLGDPLESAWVTNLLLAVGVPLIIWLAHLSYRYVEKPLYDRRWQRPRAFERLSDDTGARRTPHAAE